MKNKYACIQIYPLLFFFIFITSCFGQDNRYVPYNSTVLSNTIYTEPLVNENQAAKQNERVPWVDPLFYIDGQLCQHVRRIFQDKSGNLWFGTNVYGIMRYGARLNDKVGQGKTLEYFNKNNGYDFGRITGIVEDEEGNEWFGTYRGLSKYSPFNDEADFTNFSEADGMVNSEVWSLIIDSKGILWIGTMEGVCLFDGEKFTTFPIPKAQINDTTTHLSYNRVTCIMEDRNGTFWFGTDGFGITRYNPSASNNSGEKMFTFITKEDGLSDNNVTHILEDKKGHIWIGTMNGGISRYDPSAGLGPGGKSFTNFTLDGVVSGIEVWSIYEDRNGNIWFPAENAGVYRYDGKSFTNFSEKDGLNTNGIQSIYEDNEGRFWFGGWGGLFRYDPPASQEQKGGTSFFPVTKEGPWH